MMGSQWRKPRIVAPQEGEGQDQMMTDLTSGGPSTPPSPSRRAPHNQGGGGPVQMRPPGQPGPFPPMPQVPDHMMAQPQQQPPGYGGGGQDPQQLIQLLMRLMGNG